MNEPGLIVGAIEQMPILGQMKGFYIWNELTVCSIETTDSTGAKRGGVAIGFSQSHRAQGVATISSIKEAEVLIQLMQNAVDDAKRIEAGQQPYAEEGVPATH